MRPANGENQEYSAGTTGYRRPGVQTPYRRYPRRLQLLEWFPTPLFQRSFWRHSEKTTEARQRLQLIPVTSPGRGQARFALRRTGRQSRARTTTRVGLAVGRTSPSQISSVEQTLQ